MKKILIATACVFTLCLTSCASDQPAEKQAQVEAPQPENTEDTQETDTQNNENSEQETSEETASVDADTTEAEEVLTSEDFPEPEEIEEQEIITLEPVEELPPEEAPAPTEPVEKEEPPAITEASVQSEPETKESENKEMEPSPAENDVIIDSTQDSDDISGGIDITDDEESNAEPAEAAEEIIPSRSVTLKKFEYLDVTYPGTGWIYMGLTDNSKDIAYFGRKLGTKDTKFSLQARAAGTKIIHFYRNDPLTGQYLDDYIEVIITAENGSNKTHIAAPDYKLPVQKKEKPVKKVDEISEESETTQAAPVQTPSPAKQPAQNAAPVIPAVSSKPAETKPAPAKTATATPAPAATTTPATTTALSESQPVATTTVTEPSTPAGTTANLDSLLQEAQLLYNEKEYKAALSKLNQFFEYSTDNRDEALYIKGQILEAKSEVRDIKGAIDAYTTLTKNYPASKLWDSANKRIIYLKRFYLEVR